MSRHFWIASLAVALTLVGCAVASNSAALQIARQGGAPATLFGPTKFTLGISDLLMTARLKNNSDKPIKSYRIGWAYVLRNGVQFHAGAELNVPAGIRPSETCEVPDQTIPLNLNAERVIFFVAELTFADGSRWKANNEDIWPTAALKIPR